MSTHYEVLGIPESASDDAVRHAYRRLVKAAHPDRAGDPVRFRMITQAYDTLSNPARRAAYDRTLRPAAVGTPKSVAPPITTRRRSPYARYVALFVVVVVAGGISLSVASKESVGDDCLVGTWRGEAFEVPFRAVVAGRDIDASISGAAGVTLVVAAGGIVREDFTGSAPLTGADGARRIEGVYRGRTVARWRATDGLVEQRGTDSSDLTFQVTIDGRPPDQPLAVSVLDREYPYTCTASKLELGPYRYVRVEPPK